MKRIKSIKHWDEELTPPVIISGPCSAETEDQLLTTAQELNKIGIPVFRAGIWKPRTRPGNFEGVGSKGLTWLKNVKDKTGLKTCVEVGNIKHIYEALKNDVDILWIGARTTANPFAVQEIAEALKGVDIPIFVKNPINPDVNLWIGAIERLNNIGLTRIAAIHRGFSSVKPTIYRNSPHWQIPLTLKKEFPEISILCDPSHIAGKRSLIESVSKEALSLGFEGLMIETHINPSKAWSDSQQQLTPASLSVLLDKLECLPIKKRYNNTEINDFRTKIDEYDDELLSLIQKRMEISIKIGRYKKKHNIKALQEGRWKEIIENCELKGENLGINKSTVRTIFDAIHKESLTKQL